MKISSRDTFPCTVPEFCCNYIHDSQNFAGEDLGAGSVENETLALDVTSWYSAIWLCKLGVFIRTCTFFNVLLPVHLVIFLTENQLDAPLLIDLFLLFFNYLHVSGTMCSSSGETKLF
jgi:hypothetical protein